MLCISMLMYPLWVYLGLAADFTTIPRILQVLPHNPRSFTQGLAFDAEGVLWEGTGLYGGKSKLIKVDLETGKHIHSIALDPNLFGEGITVVNDTIYQLTWRSMKVFLYDRRDMSLLKELRFAHNGWGITSDGSRLIVSDGSDLLYFVDFDTFSIEDTCNVKNEEEKVSRLNELEYIHGMVYANVWFSDHLYVIDPNNCKVVRILDVSFAKRFEFANRTQKSKDDVLNGIAFNERTQKLYITGKRWHHLFHIAFE